MRTALGRSGRESRSASAVWVIDTLLAGAGGQGRRWGIERDEWRLQMCLNRLPGSRDAHLEPQGWPFQEPWVAAVLG